MVERGTGERLCLSIYRYAKTNNKYMKDQDKYKGLSYRQYKGVNNSYGRTISQKLAVSNFKRVKVISKFDESFLKSHNEEIDKGYFLEADVQYPERLCDFHNYLPFSPERMKIKRLEKLLANLHDKTEYFIQLRNLKQVLNQGLVSQTLLTIINFKQKAWLKSYIDMDADLEKIKSKMILKKIFLS